MFSSSAFSQDTSKFSLKFKLHPLAAINLDRPSISGSVEFLFRNKIGFEFGYAQRYSEDLKLNGEKRPDTLTVMMNGHTVFFELNYYKPTRIRLLRRLTGIETSNYIGFVYKYIDDLRNDLNYYYSHNDTASGGIYPRQDCNAKQKYVHVFLMKTGYVITYNRWLTLETYFGLGVRYKHVSYINSEIDYDKDSFPNATGFWDRPNKNGLWPSINIGLNISVKII